MLELSLKPACPQLQWRVFYRVRNAHAAGLLPDDAEQRSTVYHYVVKLTNNKTTTLATATPADMRAASLILLQPDGKASHASTTGHKGNPSEVTK